MLPIGAMPGRIRSGIFWNRVASICPICKRWVSATSRRSKGLAAVEHPTGSYGKCTLKSNGKDTTTGHWEMAGIILKTGFPTFPNGFPPRIIDEFVR